MALGTGTAIALSPAVVREAMTLNGMVSKCLERVFSEFIVDGTAVRPEAVLEDAPVQ